MLQNTCIRWLFWLLHRQWAGWPQLALHLAAEVPFLWRHLNIACLNHQPCSAYQEQILGGCTGQRCRPRVGRFREVLPTQWCFYAGFHKTEHKQRSSCQLSLLAHPSRETTWKQVCAHRLDGFYCILQSTQTGATAGELPQGL